MATLTGKTIANTYKDLLQVSNNNNGLTGTVQTISDGAGTNSALQLSNAAVNINGTFQLNGESLTVNASAINNMADIGSATGIIVVNSGSVYGRTLTAGAPVSITNANGTAGNPTITLASIANVSGSYGPFTNFGVNDYGQIVSATAVSTSVSVPTIRATELIAQTLTLSSNASIVGNVNVDGTFIVDGIVSAASDVAVGGSLYVTSNISVTGNTKTNFLQAVSASIADLNVNTLTYELVSVSALTANTLTVVSAATFNSDVTFTGASYNAVWDKSDNALEFADSARLIFGTGADLTIYHDGSNSYITESGDETGSLNIKGTNLFLLDADNEYKVGAVSGGAVTLYHDNSAAKLATTATGINVTGNVSATGFYGDGSNLTNLPTAPVSVSAYTVNQLTIVSAATLAGTDLGTKITALATSIGNSNTNITTNINAITSINSILGNGSGFATDAELQAVSATMATSIANHLPLAGGTLTGALQANSTITVGVNDTGYDVKFFGDTANAYMLWDASADDLILAEPAKLGVGAAPNATFGSFLYTQGTPTANKPIIGAYSQGNSNTAGLGLFNDSGNRGIWTTGSVMRFTRTYEGNSTDDVVINASGLVGIGTASPTAPLDVRGYASGVGIIHGSAGAASQHLMTLTDGVATNFSIVTNGSVLTLGSDAGSTQTAFKASGSEAMRIDSGGRLLINKTTLQTVNAPLQVASGLGTGQIFVGNTSGTGWMFGRDNVTTGNFVLGEVSNDSDTSVTNYLNIATGTGNATFIGMVGVGVVPTEELHLKAAAPTIRLEDSDNNLSGYINGDNGNVLLQSHNVNRDIIFGENAASGEFARIVGVGGLLGIGTSTPDGKVHIHKASAGTVTANANADELVIEDSGFAGLSILTPASGLGSIIFGDPDDNDVASVSYDHSANTMRFYTNGGEKVRIDGYGRMGIGTTAPGAELEIAGDYQPLIINSTTSSGAKLIFEDNGTTRGYIGGASSMPITFYNSSATLIGGFDSNGNFKVQPTSSTQSIKVQSSNGGAEMEMRTEGGGLSTIGSTNNVPTAIQANSGEKMRVVQDGKVGIGTTSPSAKLEVNGTVLASTDTDTSNTGSVTLDFSANQNFVLTLTGNVTLANPSTEQVGQAGVMVFIQDGTGSRTLSLGSDYETAEGAGITLSTAANAVDIVPYFVKASGSIQLGAPQLAFS